MSAIGGDGADLQRADGARPVVALARDEDGRVRVRGTCAVEEERLWLVGYGEWTGYASATLIGVGRTARSTVEEVDSFLSAPP